MTIDKRPYKQASAIEDYGLQSQGVCWELCRHWIKGHLAGTWQLGESIWKIDSDKDAFAQVQQVHVQRNKFTEANKGIDGLAHALGAERTSSCCTYSGLRSRRDVVNHVIAVKGVYAYLMTGTGNKGHAMAFDTRANPRFFFDPNQGEWEFAGESDEALRNWWDKFWDGSDKMTDINYKTAFHNGARELIRYNTIR